MAVSDAKAVKLAQVVKLLPIAREQLEKLGAVLDEVDELLGGGIGIAEKTKAVRQAFDAAWGGRYAAGETGRYLWRNPVDAANVKRLTKALGVDELIGRIARNISNEYPYIVKARHPFGLFVSGINSYASASAAPADLELDAPTVSDCKHAPRCRSDQEHTERKMRELRG